MVAKGLKKHFEAIRGEHSTDSLQKPTIIGASHIMRKVLQGETWGLSGGDHHWFNRRCNREKRACDKRR
jgi:hypothetical protein